MIVKGLKSTGAGAEISSKAKKFLNKEIEEKKDDHAHDHKHDHKEEKKKKKTVGKEISAVVIASALIWTAIGVLAYRHSHHPAAGFAATPGTQETFGPRPSPQGNAEPERPAPLAKQISHPPKGTAYLKQGEEICFTRSTANEWVEGHPDANYLVLYSTDNVNWTTFTDGPGIETHVPKDWNHMKFRAAYGPCTIRYEDHME